MARYTQQDQFTIIGHNTENEKIETAIDNMLSRKGDTPNAMETTLDMNGYRIVNLPEPVSNTDALRKVDGEQYVTAASSSAALAEFHANEAAESATEASSSAFLALNSSNISSELVTELNALYLGSFEAGPETDNEGNELKEGVLYYNTVNRLLYVFNGSIWVQAASQQAATNAAASADEAEASADAALVSEQEAALSADAASASASAASDSEAAALAAAQAASTSETNAAQSETAAASSASTAQSAATSASSSASAASSSAADAAASEAAAATSETNAGTSASQAASSATAASTSETNAASSASSASSSASAASDSADAASASASAASASETNAASSASSASSDAASAQSSATAAANSASAASVSETNAASSASAASSSESNAASSESAAASSESAAASSASAAATSESNAASSATAAADSASSASASASAASASELAADAAASAAEDARDEAMVYANALSKGLVFVSVYDASTGVYPTLPDPLVGNPFWVIGTQGTISGTVYDEGDSLIYDSTAESWIKLDTTDRVVSVAGKVGAVTLVKADVGLSNVDNTSDLNKPISSATQTALDGKVDKVTGKGLSAEDYTTAEKNKLAGIAAGAEVNTVDSVAGKTGAVTLTKSDVGLSNVDNTADSTKSVLSASKLTTARTISLSGDASGSTSFDGSGNVSITVAVANDSHTHDGRYFTEAESDARYVQQGGTSFNGEYPLVVRVSDRNFYSDDNIRFQGSDSKLTVDGRVDAPIFYDSNNTGYYVDPASTSVVNSIRFGTSTNTSTITGNSDWGFRHTTSSGWIQFGPANSGHAHIYTDRPNFYFNAPLTVNGGSTINTSDIRAPIFYDSNNTGYYIDPASTSNFDQLQLLSASPLRFGTTSTALLEHYSDSTPVAFAMRKGGNTFADGTNFGVLNLQRTNHTNSAATAGASLFFELKDSGGTLREYAGVTGRKTTAGTGGGQLDFHNYGRNVIASMNSDLFLHSSSIRAPIFYDSNNTAYYVDPASTSRLNDLLIEGEIYHNGDTNTYLQFHAADQWRVVTGGAERLEVNNSQVLASVALRCTTDITAYYSDERLKDFHGNIPNALEKVSKLGGYYFTENEKAKELGYNNDSRQVGVNAQEVQSVLPEAVAPAPINFTDAVEDGTEYLTVKYEKLVPLLIEAIKEQQTQIEALTSEINTLKEMIK